jgi:phosphate transport system substrate-binding protein
MRFVSTMVMTMIIVMFCLGDAHTAQPELTGAGATFPYPLYSKMFDVYSKEYGVKVNYQAIGSGGGIRQLINKTVDFGGTDAVMSQEDMKAAGAAILHIPVCAGAVVITYNLQGASDIQLTPSLVADIFLGRITKWNDQRIVDANKGVKLPAMPITVIHRSDGSGTTFVFSDYLAKVSEDWKGKVGAGTSLRWPTGLGAKGNPGVAGLVKQTPGSIGYVELIYAVQNKMNYSTIQNRQGGFIKPTIASVRAAANIKLPDDMMVSITDSPAADGYPISSFTWIVVYKEQKYDAQTQAKVDVLVKLLWWMTHEGQKYAAPMEYAPLSKAAAEKASALVRSITFGGARVIK